MNLHVRAESRRSDSVVVFVHGLNGDGYRTWGDFPRRIFESTDGTKPDVAVFDYFSGWRRYWRARPRVPQVAKALANCIQELHRKYDQVFLVAHSLGGLISRDAIRFYLQHLNQSPRELKRLAGLIVFASPLKGSKWALRYAWPALIEIKYLRPNSKYQTSVRKFFEMNIDTTDLDRFGNRNYMIPIYAAYGEKDWIVNFRSATDDVFHQQQHPFRAGHSSIVKPTSSSFEQVTWVEQILNDIALHRSQIREQMYRDDRAINAPGSTKRRGSFVTEMISTSSVHDWRAAYYDVLNTASTQRVQVLDCNEVGDDPDMIIAVHSAQDIVDNAPETDASIEKSKDLHETRKADVRIVSVGRPRELAKQTVLRRVVPTTVDSTPPWLFVDAVDDTQQLRGQIDQYVRLMTNVLDRDLGWKRHKATGRRESDDNLAIMSEGDF